jgi:SAP domain
MITKLISRQNWRNSPAHLLFLSRFIEPRRPEDFVTGVEWNEVLQEDPYNTISKFIDENMLLEGDLGCRLSYKYRVIELKDFLKQRGLAVSGKKNELINRLITTDKIGMENLVSDLLVLLCTDEGRKIAEDYLQNEKEKRIFTEQQTLQFLHDRKFKEACLLMGHYEAEQVFQRGIGINWKEYTPEKDIKMLNDIFSSKPKVLKEMDTTKYEKLWIVASMMYLWGTNKSGNWIDSNFETGILYDVTTTSRLIESNAYFKRDMRDFVRNGAKKVYINSYANDDLVCSACKKISGKRFNISEIPELPYEQCTSEMGCRCGVSEYQIEKY